MHCLIRYTHSLLLEVSVSPGTCVESFNMNCTLEQDMLLHALRDPFPAMLGGFDESMELTAESSFSTPEAEELPLSEPMWDVCTGQENFSSCSLQRFVMNFTSK